MPTIPRLKDSKKNKPQTEDVARKKRMQVYNNPLLIAIRKRKRQQNPLCEICLLEGKVTPTEDIHHLISYSNGRTQEERDLLAFDYQNTISLCKEHHSACHTGNYKGCYSLQEIKERYEILKNKNNN